MRKYKQILEKMQEERVFMKVLGLDIGTNSLGWAIVEPGKQKIADSGVVIFQQGIPEEKGIEAEKSPAAERCAYRAARRIKYRRRLRKYHTLKILLENGMCPLTLAELQIWIRKGVFPIENKAFISWMGSTKEANPYYFRAKAAEEKLPHMELGRAFYHLALRRGFRSSRKDAGGEAEDKDTSDFKKGISDLTAKLEEKRCTLGQYFYELFRENVKIRREHRCGRKEHYEPEFKKICEVQELPEDFVKAMEKAIFLQRPLRSQKHLAGHCTLEKKQTRCLLGHPLFERYRMLAFINSIRKDGQPLTNDERRKVQAAFFVNKPGLEFDKLIKKLYPKSYKGEIPEFNYSPDKSLATCPVTNQLQNLLDVEDLFFWRHEYTGSDGKQRTMDYQTLFDALTFFDDNDRLKNFAMKRAGMTAEQAEKFVKIRIPSGYANFSLCAIRKILPFLEAGHIQTRAVFLAKLPDLLGKEKFQKNSEKIIAEIDRIEEEWRAERDAAVTPRERATFLSLTERLKQYFESDDVGMAPGKFDLLYQYNSRSDYPDCTKDGILPKVNLGMIYNPMVYRSLNVMRRLVNHLRKTGKIDAQTEIHVELARSVNDKNTRLAVTSYQRKQEKLRAQYKDAIEANGKAASDELILRYTLWQEQGMRCLYTGRKIGWSDLLNSVDIEHTIPRSKGGDSGMANLTLCYADYNRKIKKNSLPTSCPNYDTKGDYDNSILENIKAAGWEEKLDDLKSRFEKLKSMARGNPAKRAEMLECRMELEYWTAKLETFKKTDEDLAKGGFSKRQLVDTGVMSRHAVFLLKSVYPQTFSRSGRVTEWARKAWGVQGIYDKKNRNDHVHHAIDAMCIAALTDTAYQRITSAFRADEAAAGDYSVNHGTFPWPSFPDDVFEMSEEILVRHLTQHNETKQTRKKVHLVTPLKCTDGTVRRVIPAAGDTVRGQLHNESYFGRIRDPKSGAEKSVIRKALTFDNFGAASSLADIVDDTVREAILDQLHWRMDAGKSFKDAMSEGNFRMKSKDGSFSGPAINKVRCFAYSTNPQQIRKQTYASGAEYKNYIYAESAKGSNFKAALFRTAQGKLRYELLSIWDWAKNHKEPTFTPLEKRGEPGETFVGFIAPGTMALAYENSPDELKKLSPRELKKRLYKIIELKKNGRMRLRYHKEARSGKDTKAVMKEKFGVEQTSKFSYKDPALMLNIGGEEYSGHLLFEGIDFTLSMDGEIKFMK